MPRHAPLQPITTVRFTRHGESHSVMSRDIDQALVCDAIVNGVRRKAAQGATWFFGRKVAVLARQSGDGQVTEVLTALYA